MKSLKDLFKITNAISKESNSAISKETEITNEDIFDTEVDLDISELLGENVKVTYANKSNKRIRLEPKNQNEPLVIVFNNDSLIHNLFLDYKTVIIGKSTYGAITIKCQSKSKVIDFYKIKFHFEDPRCHFSIIAEPDSIFKNLRVEGYYINIENNCTFSNCNLDFSTMFFYKYKVTFNKCKISYSSAKVNWYSDPITLTGSNNITVKSCSITRK